MRYEQDDENAIRSEGSLLVVNNRAPFVFYEVLRSI